MKTQNILATSTAADKPRESADAVLQEIFEAQADARPEAIAIVFGPESVTYAELESRANRFARHLRGRGVGPGAVVGLLLPRSTDIYVALLGILKSGAAYVPMDPGAPDARLEFMVGDAAPIAAVTTAELGPRLDGFGLLQRLPEA